SYFFFFSSRRRHTRCLSDWSSDVCSSDLPTLHLLATSREAMRVEGEHVYELFALACPPEDSGLSAHDVLQYPAVQLLVDRVRARSEERRVGKECRAWVAAEDCSITK